MLLRFTLVLSALVAVGPSTSGDRMATAVATRGQVLINDGSAFEPARQRQALHAGDRVLLLREAEVTIEFADGCRRQWLGPELLLLAEPSPCAATGPAAAIVAGEESAVAAERFDGRKLLARVGRLGRIQPEDPLDAYGP